MGSPGISTELWSSTHLHLSLHNRSNSSRIRAATHLFLNERSFVVAFTNKLIVVQRDNVCY
jgi:hypothetical protein